MSYADNIRAVWLAASDADIAVGREWYANAREIAVQVARGDSIEVGAGIIAALSPQCSWKDNVRQALARPRTARGRFTRNTKARLRVANAIHSGRARAVDALKGLKTRGFYFGIITGGLTSEVCIDRHAISICLGRFATDAERVLNGRTRKGRAQYEAYAAAYREVAAETGLSPAQLQAVTWVTWRRLKGITD